MILPTVSKDVAMFVKLILCVEPEPLSVTVWRVPTALPPICTFDKRPPSPIKKCPDETNILLLDSIVLVAFSSSILFDVFDPLSVTS